MPFSFTFRPTARSVAFVAVTFILFFTIVQKKSDILASIFVVAMMTLLLAILLYSYLSAKRLAKKLQANSWFGVEDGKSLSPLTFNTSFQNAAFSPFFNVLVHPQCKQVTDAPFALFELAGVKKQESTLQQILIFPHRGDWAVDSLSFELRDIFGLSIARWKKTSEAQVRIAPFQAELPDWPVLVSSTRAGENIEHVQTRQGDYLDLKPYHPSDGARRIVWKLFAKTRELIARQPERSVDPEGECYLYALIPTIDDAAAFRTDEYAKMLNAQDCDVVFSCLGAQGQSFLNLVEDPLVEFAFQANNTEGAQHEMEEFLTTVKKSSADTTIVKLIVSVGDSLFTGKQYDPALVAVGESCISQGITPHFLLGTSRVMPKLRELEKNLTEFFRYCADRGWEVSY